MQADELAPYEDRDGTNEMLKARHFMKDLNVLNRQAWLLKFTRYGLTKDKKTPLPDYVSISINIGLKDIANNPKTAAKLAYQ